MIAKKQHNGFRRLLLLCLCLCLSAPVFGQVSRDVKGNGPTENDAIKDALAEAVRQVNGTTVETDTYVRQVIQDSVDGIKANFSAKTEDFQHIRTASKGFVLNYEVLESNAPKVPAAVLVRATVVRWDPKNPRPGEAKTLSVGAFTMSKGALNFDGTPENSSALLDTLRDELELKMVKSRKFNVVTRQNLGALIDELKFIKGEWVGAQEKVKLQNLFGADYLISGNLDHLSVRTVRGRQGPAGYTPENLVVAVELTLSVYNVGSGKIEWRDQYTFGNTWSKEQVKKESLPSNHGALARMLVLGAAEDLTFRLISQTFPPRVIKVKSDPISGAPIFVLDATDSVYKKDDLLELVLVEGKLEDTYSGFSAGLDDTHVALVKITRVGSKNVEAQFAELTPERKKWAAGVSLSETNLMCKAWREGN